MNCVILTRLRPLIECEKRGDRQRCLTLFQELTRHFCKSSIPTPRAIPTKTAFFGPTFRVPGLPRNFWGEAFA